MKLTLLRHDVNMSVFLTHFICGAWSVNTTLATSQGQSETQMHQGWGHKFIVFQKSHFSVRSSIVTLQASNSMIGGLALGVIRDACEDSGRRNLFHCLF